MIRLELAQIEDVKCLVEICEKAKARMKAAGINQWQNGVPNENTWKEVVEGKAAYCLKNEDEDILGAFTFCLGGDVSYNEIDGEWLLPTSNNYVAIHRFCVNEKFLKQGVALKMLEAIKAKAIGAGLDSMRIDTHLDNIPMQRVIDKAGFTKCGIITIQEGVETGAPRVAYENVIVK